MSSWSVILNSFLIFYFWNTVSFENPSLWSPVTNSMFVIPLLDSIPFSFSVNKFIGLHTKWVLTIEYVFNGEGKRFFVCDEFKIYG